MGQFRHKNSVLNFLRRKFQRANLCLKTTNFVVFVKDGSGNELDKCSNNEERERVKTLMLSDEDCVQERERPRVVDLQ